VFEHTPIDLANYLDKAIKPLNLSSVRRLMLMLLRGLGHCHRRSVMHRDLKPSNLLLQRNGTLKLADFGLARVHNFKKTTTYTHQVATRWYRAPELLFGGRKYTCSIDIWAAGAIFGELLTLSPLFAGENDINQIYKVIQVLGKPNNENWYEAHELPDYSKISFPVLEMVNFAAFFSNISPDATNLLISMLQFNPAKRATVEKCIVSRFVSGRKSVNSANIFHKVHKSKRTRIGICYTGRTLAHDFKKKCAHAPLSVVLQSNELLRG
jgi:cell cycle related kinase